MNVRTKHWTLKPHRNMRQHKVFLRHELLKYNSEKSTAKSSALENYISSANLSLSGCSSAEPNSVSVGRCKFQLKKLYLQTVKKVDHLPIDDGSKTHIAFKGDGVKSLSALGLLKNMSKSDGVYSLIAIEEPESHLHPGAIHLLKDTIYELGLTNQIIISSHNPLFVNRQKIKSNIIIDCGKATVARSIKNIRDLIGVKASDNLVNANFVLVVEGEEDVIALKSILPFLSEKIARAIKSNFFIIEKVGGASNLSYKLSLLSNALCNYLVLLDNDSAGRVSYQKAIDEKLLKLKDLTLINCIGMPDSEFEDCLNKNIYEASLLEEFGVDINCSQFRSNKKWSDRIKECFNSQGKPWNEKIEAQVKEVVAKSIAKDISNCLNPHKRSSIDSLVNSIESVLDKMK